MALNLKKSGDENSEPITEKKSINLNKSGESTKSNLDLSKEKNISSEKSTVNDKSSTSGEKKKSPLSIVLLIIGLIVIGGGIFWFKNQKSHTPAVEEAPITNNDNDAALTNQPSSATPESEKPLEAEATATINSEPTNVESASGSTNGNSTVNNDNINTSVPVASASANNQSTSNTTSPSVTTAKPMGTLEEKARQVIDGAFGNNEARRLALGSEYAEIQAKVNELYRTGKN